LLRILHGNIYSFSYLNCRFKSLKGIKQRSKIIQQLNNRQLKQVVVEFYLLTVIRPKFYEF